MPELTDILSNEGLAALSTWYAEQQALDHLVRERGQQQPAPPPPTLAEISERTTGDDAEKDDREKSLSPRTQPQCR